MSSTEDIAKRAKQMDFEIKYGPQRKDEGSETVAKRMDILESRLNALSEKIDGIAQSLSPASKSNDERIVNMLWEWRSTSELSKMLGYSQEHVSRRISDMKKAGLVQEKREGKKIFYRKAN